MWDHSRPAPLVSGTPYNSPYHWLIGQEIVGVVPSISATKHHTCIRGRVRFIESVHNDPTNLAFIITTSDNVYSWLYLTEVIWPFIHARDVESECTKETN